MCFTWHQSPNRSVRPSPIEPFRAAVSDLKQELSENWEYEFGHESLIVDIDIEALGDISR